MLGLDSRPLTAGAAQAQGSLGKLSTSATRGLGAIPIGAAAAGLAIGKFAADSVQAAIKYEQAFTRIDAISNTSAANIEQWKNEVIDLAGTTAKAPVELAEALFFLSSAGIEAGDVMGVLEMAAKASASGLGSVTDVAKITANAMNAYASSGLTAAQVTDTLVAAVREGSAEPAEFAAALGRILPIASQAGVEFDEVTASLAALSNIGLDVNEGVTAMRGLLTALVAPTVQSKEALAEMGLTADQVRSSLAEDGLIGTLRLLEEASGGNIDTMKALVPNVRSLTGVFGLTTQEAAKVDEIFRQVGDSTGSLGEAFATTAESDAFKMQQALNNIKTTGQELAATTMPLLVAGMTLLSGVIDDALGPLEFLTSKLDEMGTGAAEARAEIGDSGWTRWLGPIGAGISLVDRLSTSIDDQREALTGAADAGGGFTDVLTSSTLGAAAANAAMNGLGDAMTGLGDTTNWLAKQHREAAAAAREQHLAELALAGGFLGVVANAESLADAQAELIRLQERGARGTDRYREATVQVLQTGLALKQSLVEYGASLGNLPHDQVVAQLRTLGRQWGLQRGDIGDVIGQVEDLIGRYGDVPSRVETKIMLNGIDLAMAQVASLDARLDEMHQREVQANINVTTSGGSTGFELLDMLRTELDSFAADDFTADVQVAVVDENGLRGVEAVMRGLADLTAAIGAAVQEGMSKARLLQAKELEAMASDVADNIEKLQARIRSFRDDIRSGFGQFDILGGAAGLGGVLKEQRIAALEAQIQAAQSLAAPDQVLIDALNVQLEQLRDALIVPTAAEFGAFLQDELARARSFAAGLKALQGAGLDKNLLADLASRGPEALPFIQALLAGGESLIADFNETQGTINDIAGRSMDRLVNEEFGAAIQRASERLDSLRDTIRDFVQSFDRAELPDKFEDLGKALDSMLAALDGPPGGGGNAGQGGGGGGGAAGDGGGGSSSGAQYHFHGGTFIGTTVRELAQAIDQELLQKAKRDGQAAHHGT